MFYDKLNLSKTLRQDFADLRRDIIKTKFHLIGVLAVGMAVNFMATNIALIVFLSFLLKHRVPLHH